MCVCVFYREANIDIKLLDFLIRDQYDEEFEFLETETGVAVIIDANVECIRS